MGGLLRGGGSGGWDSSIHLAASRRLTRAFGRISTLLGLRLLLLPLMLLFTWLLLLLLLLMLLLLLLRRQ